MSNERMFPPADAPSRVTSFSGKFNSDLRKQRRSLYPERWEYEGDDDETPEVDDPTYEGMGYIESAGHPLNKLKPGPYYLPSKNKRIWLSEDGSIRHIPEPTVETKIEDWAKPILAATSPILLAMFAYEYFSGSKTRSLDSTPKSANLPILKDIPGIKDTPKSMILAAGLLVSVALPIVGFVAAPAMLAMVGFGHEKIKEARFDELEFLYANGAKSFKITGKLDEHGKPMPHDKKLFMEVLKKAASYGIPVSLDRATLGWVHTLPTDLQTEIMGIVDATKLNQAKVDIVTKLNAPTKYKEQTKALNEKPKLTDTYTDAQLEQKLKDAGKADAATADELKAERQKAYLADVASGSVRTKMKGINTELDQIKTRLENLDTQGKELNELQGLYVSLLKDPDKFLHPVKIPERLEKYVDATQREALKNPVQAVAEVGSYMKVMEKPLENYMQARVKEQADLELRLQTLKESLTDIKQSFGTTPAAPGSETELQDNIRFVGDKLNSLEKAAATQSTMNEDLNKAQEAMQGVIDKAKVDVDAVASSAARPAGTA